jgi:CO/xanthine dehydrogenase Mo-binding subunit
MHEDGDIVATMIHAYYAARWVNAVFEVGTTRFLGPIDGLATRAASASEFTTHLRRRVHPPPANAKYYGRSLYAPSGSLVAVEVDPESGEVSITDVYSYLDAGRTLQPDLLSGQYQGAVAMGTGYALLENLPIGVGGAGEGDWNLNRYQVALARHLPLHRIHLETLPAKEDDTAKGIAEAVLCPIAPAIGNAVAAATGHRFRSLPITPAQIREALR